MDFYTIHIKNGNKNEEPIAIKEGFNWYSLIFNFFWPIYNRIWLLAVVYVVIQIIYAMTQSFLIDTINIKVIVLFTYILLAFHANDFYRHSLKLKGYKLVDVILAKSSGHAIYNFLKKSY